MHFTIITPCYNAQKYIEETMLSVLSQKALQSGRATLDYWIMDGNSSDNTLSLVQHIAVNAPSTVKIHVHSEPDTGMYDALAKGLRQATGDVCAYLNAGDLYSPHAFDILTQVLTSHPQIDWLTGFQTIYNEAGHIVSCQPPIHYRSRLFRCGLYNNRTLPFLQQESTFWRTSLNRYIDLEKLREFRLAGDYYLWYTFAQQTSLAGVEAHLSGFRMHRGQLSESSDAYQAEVRSIADPPSFTDSLIAGFDKVAVHLPQRLQRTFYGRTQLTYNHQQQGWIFR